MSTQQHVNRGRRPVSHRRKRKKRGVQLFIAYTLQAAIMSLGVMILLLLICGCLYIREHLSPPPFDDQGDISDYFEAPEGNVGDGANSTISAEPIIPVEPMPKTQATVVLDAGHGGIQAGCEFGGVLEKDVTLNVTLLLQEKLEDAGITIVMTRDGDQDVSLSERCDIANTAGADLFVSIHCNSYAEDTSIRGFEGYYYQSEESRLLAESILSAAEKCSSIKARNVKEENYYVLRETNIPAALLEIGYLSNANERANLQSEDYTSTIAQVIYDGILAALLQ